jgi:hypothetical protein
VLGVGLELTLPLTLTPTLTLTLTPTPTLALALTLTPNPNPNQGVYIEATDTAYLRHKWRPEGAAFLVDFHTDDGSPELRKVGEVTAGNRDQANIGWHSATAVWTGTHALNVTFVYEDEFSLQEYTVTASALVSPGGDHLTWVKRAGIGYSPNASAPVSSYPRQLLTHVKWFNCERKAAACAAGIRYDDVPAAHALAKNTAQTPHFYGAKEQFVLPLNRRYQFEVSEGINKIQHIEKMKLWMGPGMVDGDWIEFEVQPFGVYQEYDKGIRPLGAVPLLFEMDGSENVMDFASVNLTRNGSVPLELQGRRLSGGDDAGTPRSSFTWNGERNTVTLRIEGGEG